MGKKMGQELWYIILGKFIKGCGKMIRKRDMEFRDFRMDAVIEVNIVMGSQRERVAMSGPMVSIMMGNGDREKNMGRECGEGKREIHIRDSGV